MSQQGTIHAGPRELHAAPRGDHAAGYHAPDGVVLFAVFGGFEADLWFGHEVQPTGQAWARLDEDRFVWLTKNNHPPEIGGFSSGVHAKVFTWDGGDTVEVGPFGPAWPPNGGGIHTSIYPPFSTSPPSATSGNWYWAGYENFAACCPNDSQIVVASLAYRTESVSGGGQYDMVIAVANVDGDVVTFGDFIARSWVHQFNGLNGCVAFCLPRDLIPMAPDRIVWVSNEKSSSGEPGFEGLSSFHYITLSGSTPSVTEPVGLGLLGGNGEDFYRVDSETIVGAILESGQGDPASDGISRNSFRVVSCPGSGFSLGPRVVAHSFDAAAGHGVNAQFTIHRTVEDPRADCTEFWYVSYLNSYTDDADPLPPIMRVGRMSVVGTSVELGPYIDYAGLIPGGYDPVLRATEDELVVRVQDIEGFGFPSTWRHLFVSGGEVSEIDLGTTLLETTGVYSDFFSFMEPKAAFEKDGVFILPYPYYYLNGSVVALLRLGSRYPARHDGGTGTIHRRDS